MCDKFCKCENCFYFYKKRGKKRCTVFGVPVSDSAFCRKFRCCDVNCKSCDCASSEELEGIWNGN